MSNPEKDIKIVVISALREELAYLLAKQEEFNWQSPQKLEGKYSYHLGTLKNKEGKTCQIAAVPQPLDEMGLIDAAILSTIAISKLKPEYIVLIGICGGIEGSVNLGDIIIPRQAFHYQSGKLQGTGNLKKGLIDEKADGNAINNIINFFEGYSPNEIVKKAIDSRVVKIGGEFKHLNIPPRASIKVHYLNIASADLVNDHPNSIQAIETQHDRKAIAFDMESLAVLKAAAELDTKAVIIKSVSDIPTNESPRETQENYRDFAKFAATEAFYQFATDTDFFFELDNINSNIPSKPTSVSTPQTALTPGQRQRLQETLTIVKRDYDLQRTKTDRLREATTKIDRNTNPTGFFQLEQQLLDERNALAKLGSELDEIEQKLQ